MANIKSIDLESGDTEYLTCGDKVDSLHNITGDFTAQCWVKFESFLAGDRITFMGKWTEAGNQRSWIFGYLHTATKYLELIISQDGGAANWFFHEKEWTPNLNTWYHVAAVYNAATQSVEFFVNGVSIGAEGGGRAAVFAGTGDFYIGHSAGRTAPFDGKIDDSRVYNATRTEAQIAGDKDQEIAGDAADLVGYWKFNDTLNDEHANSNDLNAPNGSAYDPDVPFGAVAGRSFGVII